MRRCFANSSLCLLGLLAALVFPHFTARAGFKAFLQLPKIPGDSGDKQHPGWIEITGISGSHAEPVDRAKSVFANLCLQKRVDPSSPLLALDCARGTILTNAVIEVVRTGATPVRFYRITLDRVIVKRVVSVGDRTSDAKPIETVCLSFGKITWVYTEFTPTGKPGPDTTTEYNLQSLTGVSPSILLLTGTQRTDGLLEVAWTGLTGQTYTILGSSSFAGPFQPLLTIPVTRNGPVSQSFLPPEGDLFFQIVQQPTPDQP